MARLNEFLIPAGRVLIGPGAMGTELQLRGLPPGAAPEAWNVERGADVVAVYASYARAGSAWLVVNSFGANRPRLAQSGLVGQIQETHEAAVLLARRAAPDLPLLASLGPTGGRTPAESERAYEEQVQLLAALGIDGFLVETVVRLDEGSSAVRAAARSGHGPVLASFTPDPVGDLLDGTRAERAAEAWLTAGASAVGVNCGTGPEHLVAAVRRLAKAALAPLYAAPNAGLPKMEGGRASYGLTPDAFARAAIQFQEVGVTLIAGCCGTTPRHIRAAVTRIGRGT